MFHHSSLRDAAHLRPLPVSEVDGFLDLEQARVDAGGILRIHGHGL
jgi:hypothetical protein